MTHVFDESDKEDVIRQIETKIDEFKTLQTQIESAFQEMKASGDEGMKADIKSLETLHTQIDNKITSIKSQIEGPDPVVHGSNPDTGTNE